MKNNLRKNSPFGSTDKGGNMKLIEERQSIRKYSDKEIPVNVLKSILNAGRLAPSWMNVQSWKFIVVRNKENKEMLSKLACNQPHVRNCDSVIVCVADTGAWDKENFSKILKQKGITDSAIENIMTMPSLYPPLSGEDIIKLRTVEQLTYAIAYMTLEAEAQDVRACIIGAMANELTGVNPELADEVKNKLGLGSKEIIAAMLTLGYETEPAQPHKLRKDFNEVVFLEKSGNLFE